MLVEEQEDRADGLGKAPVGAMAEAEAQQKDWDKAQEAVSDKLRVVDRVQALAEKAELASASADKPLDLLGFWKVRGSGSYC